MAKVLGKRVLIFGGTGSLGRALIGRWGKENEVGIFSRDEAKHWTIKNQESTDSNLSFFVFSGFLISATFLYAYFISSSLWSFSF